MTEYAVVNPATDQQINSYPTIASTELKDAIRKAYDTRRELVDSTTVEERAALLGRVGELHIEHRQRLGEILVLEMGKPIQQALGEIDFCGAIYDYYHKNAAKMLADEPIELSEGSGSAFIRRSSIGVVLGIMPWNYPYYQACRFASPNLAIGNTVLLKPAPQCPESAAALEQLFEQAGFPPGAYTTIYASNEQVETIIADPRVQGVSVTGSERAGIAVAEIAGRHLKKVVLELGGSDPFILLSTDNIDSAVDAAVEARLENAGQACNAAKRFIVADDLYQPFVDELTTKLTAVKAGDPSLDDTAMGPLSSKAAADRLEDQLRRAVDQGAVLVAGGGRTGNSFVTTVLTDVKPDNDAYREELFGPVAVVYRVGSEEEAIHLANDTPFGLGAYVFTTDREQALRVADKIDSGMVWINIVNGDAPELPFGGVKNSGFGRELGRLGFEEFANKKMIRMAS
jgi:succinate-semialdehyde dehydrogenase/glutarate-semialdehyde dehydrogenase